MNKQKYFLVFMILNICFSKYDNNTLIVSFSSKIENLKSAYKVIYSILEQKIDNCLYKILLIFKKN